MLNISNKVLTVLYQLFMKMPSKRMKYTAKFKLQVVKFVEETNNCAASREFCVHEKFVIGVSKLKSLSACLRTSAATGEKSVSGQNLKTNLLRGSKSRGSPATS